MQKRVRSEDDKNQSKKNTGNDRDNFHPIMVTRSGGNSNVELGIPISPTDRHCHSWPNSLFKSAEGALSARGANVPLSLIARAARRNAPQAANARPDPTEIRRTPRSASRNKERS